MLTLLLFVHTDKLERRQPLHINQHTRFILEERARRRCFLHSLQFRRILREATVHIAHYYLLPFGTPTSAPTETATLSRSGEIHHAQTTIRFFSSTYVEPDSFGRLFNSKLLPVSVYMDKTPSEVQHANTFEMAGFQMRSLT